MIDDHHEGDHFVQHVVSEMISGHGSVGGHSEPPNERLQNRLRLAAAASMMLAAGFGLFEQKVGNTVFSFIGAALLVLSLVPDDVSSMPRRVAGIAVNTTLLDIYRAAVHVTRRAFQRGDAVVRGTIVFLAVGGMALVCKYGINNFDMLPPYADLALKRLGPPLAVTSLIVFPATLISKRIFALSMHTRDRIVRKYEFRFYLSVILLSITILILGAGLPIEGKLPPRGDHVPTSLPHWEPDSIRLIFSIALIWLIWVLGTGACIVSRFFEWNWRDRINSYLGQPRP